MMPAHVTVLETDASWNAVCGVTRIPFSRRPSRRRPSTRLVAAHDGDGDPRGIGVGQRADQELVEGVGLGRDPSGQHVRRDADGGGLRGVRQELSPWKRSRAGHARSVA